MFLIKYVHHGLWDNEMGPDLAYVLQGKRRKEFINCKVLHHQPFYKLP